MVTKGEFKRISATVIKEELKKGSNRAHWINNHNDTISCSHCHTWFYRDRRCFYMRYCPYCGLKMVESEGKK